MATKTDDQDSSGTVTEQNTAQAFTNAGNAIADGLANMGKIPEDISEHAKGVLKDMAPEDIAKFAPKVKEWDQGVTKLLEEKNKQLAPFKGLNPEEVQAALEINQLIKTDPKRAVEFLQSQYNVVTEPPETPVEDQTEQELYDSLPKIIRDKLESAVKAEQVLEVIAKERAEALAAKQYAEDMQAYNQLMAALEEKHGKFNKDIVTASIASGIDPDQAVLNFKAAVQEQLDELLGEHNNAPRTLSGKSVLPVTPPDVRKMSNKDTANLVAKMLEEAKNS